MAFVISDRIKMTTTTTGTGTITLGSAVTGFSDFSPIGNANTTGYAIIAVDANGVPTGEWETGIGTYTSSGTTLSRGVIKSSNSNALVNFAAGTKHVIVTDIAGYLTPLVMTTTANRAIQVADQTALSSTSGNARGKAAVDLQIKRTSTNEVAAGDYAGILSGRRNRIVSSGVSSVISGGQDNLMSTSTDAMTIAGGKSNTVSAHYGVVGGGTNNTSSGFGATVSGGINNTASIDGSTVSGGKNNISSSSGYPTVSGGYGNTASGHAACVAGGRGNTASGGRAFVGGGQGNLANESYAVVVGGYSNTASGPYSIAIGKQALSTRHGQIAHASGNFANQGDSQGCLFQLRKITTDATPTELFLDGSSSRLVLVNNSCWMFVIQLCAWRTDTKTTGAGWFITGVIERTANAASTTLVGTNTSISTNQDTGALAWTVAVTADTTNGSLKIAVTGEAAKTIQWVAKVSTVEITG